MWQSFMPWTDNGQLLRAQLGRHSRHRMHGVMCSLASGPIHGELIRSMLDPDVGLATVPVGERTDAIAGAEYVVQPILQQLKRNAEVHLLRDLVCRLNVQGQL